MHSEPDVTRVVRSWLRTDEHESADRVLDNVLNLLDTTQQRRSWWPAWRLSDMHTYAKFAIAAAAVVVVAVVGINLLPASGGGGGGGLVVSPSPSPTPRPSASSTPASEFPPPGPLAAGTHRAVIDGVPLSFIVPSPGWTSPEGGNSINKGEYGQSDSLSVIFWWSAPENVYADPCAHTPLSPPPSTTAAGLAAAVATIPGTDLVTGPSSIDVDGHPARYVVLKIREDLGCDPKTAYLWYDESSGGASGGWRWASALGTTIRVWIVDVDGKLVWIDGETFKGAGPELGQEINKLIDSIKFE
jgi:hypothetical protein